MKRHGERKVGDTFSWNKLVWATSLGIAALSFLSIATLSRAQTFPDLYSICTKAPKYCLAGLLTLRCGEILVPLSRPQQHLGCSYQGQTAAGIIDPQEFAYEVNDGTKTHTISDKIIFVPELETLIQDKDTQTYLKNLSYELGLAYRGTRSKSLPRLNLWTETLKESNHDFALALQRLGVLFQDTRSTRLAYKYLEKKFQKGKASQEVINALADMRDINTLLNPEELKESLRTGNQNFDLFPEDLRVETIFSPKVYHFYPIAYMAHKLKNAIPSEKLKTSFHQALFIPILFRAEAEFRSIMPNTGHFWLEDVKLDPNNVWHQMVATETYSAIFASYFGFQIPTPYKVAPSKFAREYLVNPTQRLQKLYDELPRL